ncbi:MAG: DUF3592 domain-containing protein [Ruthenibacterium sp.]
MTFLVLFYAMAALWLWYGVSLMLRDRALAVRGVHWTAHIKGNETTDGGRTFRPVFGYTYEGRYYETTCRFAEKTKYDVGAPLDIVFLPGKPDKPERAGTSMRQTSMFSVIIGVLSLAAAVYLTFWR